MNKNVFKKNKGQEGKTRTGTSGTVEGIRKG
jgi:hypothetical protein